MLGYFNFNFEEISRRAFESCGVPKRFLEGSANESSARALQEMLRRS